MTDETGKVASDLKVDMAARANLFWIALLVSLAGSGIYFMVENIERLLVGISLFGLSLLLFSSMEEDGGAPIEGTQNKEQYCMPTRSSHESTTVC